MVSRVIREMYGGRLVSRLMEEPVVASGGGHSVGDRL